MHMEFLDFVNCKAQPERQIHVVELQTYKPDSCEWLRTGSLDVAKADSLGIS